MPEVSRLTIPCCLGGFPHQNRRLQSPSDDPEVKRISQAFSPAVHRRLGLCDPVDINSADNFKAIAHIADEALLYERTANAKGKNEYKHVDKDERDQAARRGIQFECGVSGPCIIRKCREPLRRVDRPQHGNDQEHREERENEDGDNGASGPDLI